MLYWNNLRDDVQYVIDLVQLPTGIRMIRFRKANDLPHEHTALRTEPRPGRELKALGREQRLSLSVPTTDGRLFVLDPHDIWMTQEEAEYWRANRSQAALENPDAPWVNHIPPKFAPK
jgi:hypothetical protein